VVAALKVRAGAADSRTVATTETLAPPADRRPDPGGRLQAQGTADETDYSYRSLEELGRRRRALAAKEPPLRPLVERSSSAS
jgi:hypothetical protein